MGKAALQSRSIIAGVVAALAALAPIFGWALSETDQTALQNVLESGFLVVSNLIAFVAAVMAIYGRWNARQKITGTMTAGPSAPNQPTPPGSLER